MASHGDPGDGDPLCAYCGRDDQTHRIVATHDFVPPDAREDPPPPGFAYTWVPDKGLDGGLLWQLVDPANARPCRFTVGPDRTRCARPSVARLNRALSGREPRWWHYCGDHLFGRRIRAGRVETRILRPIEPGGGG